MLACQVCGGQMGQLDLSKPLGGPEHIVWICHRCMQVGPPVVLEPEPLEFSNTLELVPAKQYGELFGITMQQLKREVALPPLSVWETEAWLPTTINPPLSYEAPPLGERYGEASGPYFFGIDPGSLPGDLSGLGHAAPPVPDTELPPDRPVLEGTVIGYRAWRINQGTWQLQGTGANHGGPDWVPGVNVAEHGNGTGRLCHSEPAPGEDCDCGLNALARFSDSDDWWDTADTNKWSQIVGAVEAWSDETDPRLHKDGQELGRFYLHTTGFRAQYARVVLLAIEDDAPRAKVAAVRALAAEHRADICKRQHLEDAAKEHGQLVPDELLQYAARQERETAPHNPPGYKVVVGPRVAQANFGPIIERMKEMEASFKHMVRVHETSLESFREYVNVWSSGGIAIISTARQQGRKANLRPKGVKSHLGTVGPPGWGKWRRGDIVQDRKHQTFICVNPGSPGSWAPYDPKEVAGTTT